MIVRVAGAGLLPPSARKTALVASAVRKALGVKSRAAGELSVVFLSRAAMRRMNKRYLGHDYDTDVIAFSYPRGPQTVPGEPFGDVFISAHMVRLQAKELGHSALKEAVTLAVHGTLHLLGYDDHRAADKARMFRRQDALVREALEG